MTNKKNRKDTNVPVSIDDTREQFYIDNYLNDPNNIYEPAIKKHHVNVKKSNIRNKNWTLTYLI
jgi:tRNA A37 threonylcarbamoyladenosine modification protein TsaB